MYGDDDLDAAVREGILTSSAVTAFRDFAARRRAPEDAASPDEESVRLITSFNDLFVSIAAGLLLGALAWLAGESSRVLAGALVAGAAWAFAEYFTRRRRMALPSIVLLVAYVWGVFSAALVAAGVETIANSGFPLAAVAAVTAVAAYGHWRRFRVPITVAAAAGSVALAVMAAAMALVPAIRDAAMPLMALAGLALFALAMRWDMSDPLRRTRRSDVAFWLHLAAAPLIVHPVFSLLRASHDGAGNAVAALAVYLALAVVALVVDRRALLVSALAYVLYATSALVQAAGSLSQSFALTALIIGSALLTLSALWPSVRRRVLVLLPASWCERLPPVQHRP